jgi:putative redox protein
VRTVNVSWDVSGGRFTAVGTHASHQIEINAPRLADETRGSTGFSATELLLAGAGACSAWDVVEMVRKRRQHLLSLDVTVEGHQRPDPPWSYERVVLHYRIGGDGLRLAVMKRVIRLSALRYCSVLSTIGGVAAIEATVEVVDSDGTTTGRYAVDLSLPPAVLEATDVPSVGVPEPLTDED